ncbi:hypothetical protein [Streptomyces sp. 404i]|uniref:DUF6941 family protein n=1 Tax=unclassified Streptomyces TaxID=2593676 RepID=UPI001B36D52E|nr:hypothetical protein [Streptomyces sp. 404i]MBQ1105898.1 hypothetical protein [Streptomyces sp. 404i]
MKLSMAALCDRATVREGLLHVLGAGVTVVAMPLPAPLDVDLAILLSPADYAELEGSHKLTVTVAEVVGGRKLGEIQAGWFGPGAPPEEELPYPSLPVSVPLRGLPIQSYGRHHVVIEVDGTRVETIEFLVRDPGTMLPGVTSQPR